MKAMILAAGFGTRLQPYSLSRPKPLFPVLNTPLLLQIIQRLQDAGFDDIAVNSHHLAPQIQVALVGITGVRVFHEDVVLGTGGALKNIEAWCDGESLLVTNGDIFHDFDFAKIWQYHTGSTNLATLVCHDYPRFNKVSLGDGMAIKGFTPCGDARCIVAFTGIHVVEPEVLAIVVSGFSSIIDCYQQWILRGESISAMLLTGGTWIDMGTPADYLQLHRFLLAKEASPFLVHPSVVLEDVGLQDWVAVGAHAKIGAGCILERVVVWDGAEVASGAHLKDVIVI